MAEYPIDLGEEPELAKVLQEDQAHAAVLVRQAEPLRVEALPTRAGGMTSFGLTTTAESVAGKDPRRNRLVVLATGDSIYIGTDRQQVSAGASMLWPAGTSLEIKHADQVFARAAATTCTLSIMTEMWAD
jgi:hypothetical protein